MKYEESENLLFSFLSSSWSNSLRFLRTAWCRQLRDNKWATKWCYKSGRAMGRKFRLIGNSRWRLWLLIPPMEIGRRSAAITFKDCTLRYFNRCDAKGYASGGCETRLHENPIRKNYFHEKLRQARRKKKHINPRNEIILRVFWGSEEGKLFVTYSEGFLCFVFAFSGRLAWPKSENKARIYPEESWRWKLKFMLVMSSRDRRRTVGMQRWAFL